MRRSRQRRLEWIPIGDFHEGGYTSHEFAANPTPVAFYRAILFQNDPLVAGDNRDVIVHRMVFTADWQNISGANNLDLVQRVRGPVPTDLQTALLAESSFENDPIVSDSAFLQTIIQDRFMRLWGTLGVQPDHFTNCLPMHHPWYHYWDIRVKRKLIAGEAIVYEVGELGGQQVSALSRLRGRVLIERIQ